MSLIVCADGSTDQREPMGYLHQAVPDSHVLLDARTVDGYGLRWPLAEFGRAMVAQLREQVSTPEGYRVGAVQFTALAVTVLLEPIPPPPP